MTVQSIIDVYMFEIILGFMGVIIVLLGVIVNLTTKAINAGIKAEQSVEHVAYKLKDVDSIIRMLLQDQKAVRTITSDNADLIKHLRDHLTENKEAILASVATESPVVSSDEILVAIKSLETTMQRVQDSFSKQIHALDKTIATSFISGLRNIAAPTKKG